MRCPKSGCQPKPPKCPDLASMPYRGVYSGLSPPQGGGERNEKIRNREEKSKGKRRETKMRKEEKRKKRRKKEIVNSLPPIVDK